MVANRSAWQCPGVQDALREGRAASAIALLPCPRCGNWTYYNEGSHFSCSMDDCDYSASGDTLDRLIDEDLITLDDLDDEAEEGP